MKKILLFGALLIFIYQFCFSQNYLESKYDVKQYILDLQVSNSSTVISGSVIVNANVTATSLDTFVVELIDTLVAGQTYMVVDSVFVDGASNTYRHHDELVYVPLTTAIPQNQSFSVQIFYHGNGEDCSQTNYSGISHYNYSGVMHTCTFSETTWSKVWWPCKQDLSDKADSAIIYITTDSLNISGSNGILESTEYLLNGKVKYKWVTRHPIDFYLISYTVGPFIEQITYASLPNTQDSVLLQSLLIPASPYYQDNLKAINKTKQLLYLFSGLIGDYPFKDEKYGYCVIGTQYRAMEHQTMCTIGYLAMDTTISVIGNYAFWYVAHELAHQWFGDYVTCATWSYIWFNEGFASYMEYVALQNIESQARADFWINDAHAEVMTAPGGSVYVPDSLCYNENNIMDYRLQYKKGSSILHILRYEINNDSLFFAVLRNFLSAHAYSVATADDFKQVAEATTGMDFTDFLNQWYYGEGYPIFDISWSQNGDTITINSNQTTSSPVTPLFTTHFDIKINYLSGDTIIRLYQGSNFETYNLYIPEAVTSLEMDPDFWLIQKNNLSAGIDEIKNPLLFDIFPNPSSDYITINIPEMAVIDILTITGQIVKTIICTSNVATIDLKDLSSGVYIVKAKTDKEILTKKIIKE